MSAQKKPHTARAYSRGEEMGNTLSHAVGTALSAIGLVLLIIKALRYGDGMTLFTSLVYGGSLLLLYSMSTLYHGSKNPAWRGGFRVMDHCSIFLLIAGTYTPYALITLRYSGGPMLLALLWAIAVAGVILNAISVDRFHTISQVGYLAMGWAAVTRIKPLIAAIDPAGLTLLVAGGLCYTVGIVFYLLKNVPYFHTVWHFFVIAGSLTHFASVYRYVLPGAA